MQYTKPRGLAEMDRTLALEMEENVRVLPRENLRVPVADHRGPSAENLDELLNRVSETSKREIDYLIDELHTLRGKLQSETDRIKHDIANYAAVTDQVMQLTRIMSESVQKIPDAPQTAP